MGHIGRRVKRRLILKLFIILAVWMGICGITGTWLAAIRSEPVVFQHFMTRMGGGVMLPAQSGYT